MLEVKSRSVYDGGFPYDVVFSRDFVHATKPLSKVHTFFVPAFSRLYEEMTPNSTGSSQEWKNFEHYKVYGFPISEHGRGFDHTAYDGYPIKIYPYQGVHPTNVLLYTNFPQTYGDLGRYSNNLPLMYVKRQDGGFVPPPTQLDALNSAALKTMLPTIKAELSVLNSLLELKDFRSLPRTVSSIWSTASSLVRRARTPLRQILRAGADGYLQQQFNLLPLLSDISGIHAALSRTEARMNALLTRQGRVQRRHYTYRWNELGSYTSEQSSSVSSGNGGDFAGEYQIAVTRRLRRETWPESTVFHAEIEYNYNYTRYQVEHARLLSFLDAFGVNLNPAIIWNAIPWSFVVDWVLGVSRWLDSLKTVNMDPVVNIRRYLWSVTRKRLISVSAGNSRTAVLPPKCKDIPPVPLPLVHEEAYRRQVGMPEVSSIVASGVNFKEFTLGAALVFARKWRPRNRVRSGLK
jgi:hypothetical protein